MTPDTPREGPEGTSIGPARERARSRRSEARGFLRAAPFPAVALALLGWMPEAGAEVVFTSEPPQEAQVGLPYTYTMSARLELDGGGDGGDGGDGDDGNDDDGDGGDGGDGGDDDGDDDDGGGNGGGDALIRFFAPSLPDWLAFDGAATIAGTPTAADVGSHPVVLRATANGETAVQRFSITVSPPPNSPPEFEGAPSLTVNEGASVDIDLAEHFSDPDSDPLTFAARDLPGWLELAGARITGVAPDDAAGSTVSVVVTATDDEGASAMGTFSIAIVAVNDAPRLERPIEPDPQHAFVGEDYALDAGSFFVDPDGDALTFDAVGLPASFAIAANGRITGRPTTADVRASAYSVTVRASDPAGAAASDTFALIVEARNRGPVLVDPLPDPQTASAGEPYRFDAGAFFDDPDGDALAFTAAGLPASLSIDPATGVVAGTPTAADAGTYPIRVTASDLAASASGRYSLTVQVVDEPPVLPDPPPALTTPEDTPLAITPELLDARDEDPARLTVVLAPPSDDASFTVSDGHIVVPNRDFNGTLTVGASVRDARATSNRVTITITVTPINDPPRIDAVPPQSASEGTSFELALADFVDDPDDDPITFSAAALPAGLSIDGAGGMISGIPTVGAAGVHTVRFTAHDAATSASGSFELRITAAGRADLAVSAGVAPNPVLAGAPAVFSFTVSNGSQADVGTASLEVTFTADAPFSVDDAAEPACVAERPPGSVVVRCTLVSVAAGGTRSVDVTARAEQAAEIVAAASVAIADAVPIDEMPDNDTASATLVVARSLGDGAAQELGVPGVGALAVGDFDGDGVEDLAAANAAGGPLLVFLNRPVQGNETRVALDPGPIAVGDPLAAVDIAAADLDGDGDFDLVGADAGGAHRLLLNDGTGGFTSSALAGGPLTERLEVADVDGDALPDIAFAGRSDGANVVLRNAGGGEFRAIAPLPVGASVDLIATDVIGGGALELVFAGEAGDLAVVSVSAASAEVFTFAARQATSLASADFDGDGRADLVLAGGEAGQRDTVHLNTSGGAPSFFLAAELGLGPTVAVLTGDFDVDGRADIVAINAAGGHRLYTNGTAANLAFVLHAEQFATVAAAAAAAGDLNGDGRSDVAVAGADAVAVFLNDGRGNLGRGDESAPSLSLLGEPTMTVTVGESYVDPGATAIDDVDGDLTDRIVVDNPVDVAVIGTYTVSYDVADSSGNAAATLTRTVEVRARDAGGGGGGGALGFLELLSLGTALGSSRALRRTSRRVAAKIK